jgi:hypothetical protein
MKITSKESVRTYASALRSGAIRHGKLRVFIAESSYDTAAFMRIFHTKISGGTETITIPVGEAENLINALKEVLGEGIDYMDRPCPDCGLKLCVTHGRNKFECTSCHAYGWIMEGTMKGGDS